MEATGVYCTPAWAVLEDDFDRLLVDARHVKNVAQAPARPRPRARRAQHWIICAIWQMLSTGELYRELGGDCFPKRDPERQTRRLISQLENLGHKVTLEALPQAA